MYNRIVLAYDGSEMGREALLGCREIAELTLAEIFLIAVLPPAMEVASGEAVVDLSRFEDEERMRFRAILDDGVKRLAALGHAVRVNAG